MQAGPRGWPSVATTSIINNNVAKISIEWYIDPTHSCIITFPILSSSVKTVPMMSDVPNCESMVSPIVLTDENHASSVTGATNVPYTQNTNNDNHELALFPSYFICPITQQPPMRGVTFDIPEYGVQS